MRGMSYTRATKSADQRSVANSFVSEALSKQAALRPPKTPPKLMPVTPTLPRIRKGKPRRRPT